LRLCRETVVRLGKTESALVRSLQGDSLLVERLERLMTIPAVGPITALTWALEVGELQRFSSIKKAISYCGLCGAERSSAEVRKRTPLSKQRNKHLQTTLIEAAKMAPRISPDLAALYDREKQKAMPIARRWPWRGSWWLTLALTHHLRRACWVARRELGRGGAAGQPAAHQAAISVVGRAKRGAEMRLFVQDDKEMSEQKPRQSEEQNCERLLEQAEAQEHDETTNIHRIAHELVWTDGNELARWVDGRGRAFPADDEGRHTRKCESSTGSHQRNAQSGRPGGQHEAQSGVVAVVQA
jgi:hypothetical protein